MLNLTICQTNQKGIQSIDKNLRLANYPTYLNSCNFLSISRMEDYLNIILIHGECNQIVERIF